MGFAIEKSHKIFNFWCHEMTEFPNENINYRLPRSQNLNDHKGNVEAIFIKDNIKFETNSIISQSKVCMYNCITNHHLNYNHGN